ncbi:putative regulator pra-like protein [Actinokineospora spheciospongiae]|uniref:Putative regulator pra-like protein n=1 Tax=Actinokineospora spheciospongiae TaxID=909613 RepID=W7INW1_9PSEU|nr:putative regulator pra-like protein [Actinokineospora spheciospongiae]
MTDPSEVNSKRASFDLVLLADVQPVPTTAEVLPGLRPVELDGLTAEPRVAGNGEFKYQAYVFRATGFRAAGSGAGSRPSRGAGESEKAA